LRARGAASAARSSRRFRRRSQLGARRVSPSRAQRGTAADRRPCGWGGVFIGSAFLSGACVGVGILCLVRGLLMRRQWSQRNESDDQSFRHGPALGIMH
jgi:hypothetical protein